MCVYFEGHLHHRASLQSESGESLHHMDANLSNSPVSILIMTTPWCLAVRCEAAGHARKRAGIGCTSFERRKAAV